MSLENGKIGEIIVSGPHVLKQYFKNAEAIRTNKIIVNELMWHRTGDSGMLIKNELFLTGRCSQLIKNQEGYLSPFIIENQLQNITGINFGTLLSFQDQHVLVVESPLNLKQLEPLLVDIPHDKVVILNKIPRDPRHNSKIAYAQLKIILAKE
jgi:long-subunit acyl-CoA synthetase (AMP-forming)